MCSWWHLNDLRLDSRSLVFDLFNLVFVIIYKNLLKERPVFLVLKGILVLSKSKFPFFLLFSSFVPVYHLFHLLVKVLLLLSCDNSAHFISSVFIQKDRFEVLSILRLELVAETLFVLLDLLIEVVEIGEFRYFLLIDVLGKNVMVLLLEFVDFILFGRDSQRFQLFFSILLHERNWFDPFIDHSSIFRQLSNHMIRFILLDFKILQELDFW